MPPANAPCIIGGCISSGVNGGFANAAKTLLIISSAGQELWLDIVGLLFLHKTC